MLIAMLLLASTISLDPEGHWEGAVQVPDMEMKIAVDLATNAKGELAGTFARPEAGLKGFPLRAVVVDGRTLRFTVPSDGGIATFEGTFSSDGTSISGTASRAGESAPFSLTRTGDAIIAPAPKSAPIGKELEGTWNGTLDVGGKTTRLILTMANQADGTAAGTIVSPDGSGVELPVAMTQDGANLTVTIEVAGATFAGVLKDAELTGTWKQGPVSLPLTFKRTE